MNAACASNKIEFMITVLEERKILSNALTIFINNSCVSMVRGFKCTAIKHSM